MNETPALRDSNGPKRKTLTLSVAVCALAAGIAIVTFVTGKDSIVELFSRNSALDNGLSNDSRMEIREMTASAVRQHLKGLSGRALVDRFDQLFKNRWVRQGGWAGTVVNLPDRNSGKWRFEIREEDNDTNVMVRDVVDASRLRAGDCVIVRGQLEDFISGKLILRSATYVQVDFGLVKRDWPRHDGS